MWFDRDLRHPLGAPSLPARVLVGPRQSGKSSLLGRLYPEARWLSFDDLQIRVRAQEDPALLLESAGIDTGAALVLDEAAYSPNVFPEIKRRIDLARRNASVEPRLFVTGSNRLLLDRSVRESLAGRASYYFLHSLSVAELGAAATLPDWLFRGGWPELYVRPELEPPRYLGDYVRTFVEKDIAATAGVERLHEFQRALALLAARTGTLLNATDVGQLAGVKGQTISGWLDLLEQNALTLRLRPYHSNLNKRLVKTPKLYFLDTGLAAYLQGWQSAAPLLASPQAGPLFETLVLGELVRARDHRGLALTLFFWRTKEGEEVDFLVQGQGRTGPRWFAIEAKLAIQNVPKAGLPRGLAAELPELTELWVVTAGGAETRVSAGAVQVPVTRLADKLTEALAAD